MINKLNNTLSFRNNTNNNTASIGVQDNQSLKKDWLNKHYEDQYVRDTKTNNNSLLIDGSTALASFIGSLFTEKHKGGMIFTGCVFSLVSFCTYLCRPQKEKYEAQVQIDLNKESTDANNIKA